ASQPRERARRVGVVLTDRVDIPLARGRDLVALGRHPHTALTGRLTEHDRRRADWAISAVGAAALADRRLDELSDGERQRLFVARALAQEPSMILLDEPSAFLDAPSRVALTALLRRLARDRGLAVVVSTHDLDLALRVADHAWLLDRAGTLHAASPEQLILDGRVGAVFDTDELRFDLVTASFVPRPRTIGTARVRRAAPVEAPTDAAVEGALDRALRRDGWLPAADGPVDLEIAVAGGTEPGRTGAFRCAAGGQVTTLPDLAAVLDWLRKRTTARPADGWPVRRADPADTRARLTELAAAGPYFAVDTAPPPTSAPPSGEVLAGGPRSGPIPIGELYRDTGRLAPALDDLGVRLGSSERRVAASTLQLGHAARLWSIALGCWVSGGVVPDLDAERLLLVSMTSSPIRLRLTDAGGWQPRDPGDLATVADLLTRAILEAHLRPFAEALRAETHIASGLLWGNAASALVGAARVLAAGPSLPDRPAGHEGPPGPPADPDGRRRLTELAPLVATVLSRPPLADAGRFLRLGAGSTPQLGSFRRRSCCLFYRTPRGGTCGDCPLLATATTATTATDRRRRRETA
ncbi:ATP-binding cassette domain-containing protein, partial [Frankia sp. AvcI1]